MDTEFITYLLIFLFILAILPDRVSNKIINKYITVFITLTLVWFYGEELVKASIILYFLGAAWFGYDGKTDGMNFRIEKDPNAKDTIEKLFMYKVIYGVTLIFSFVLLCVMDYVSMDKTTKDFFWLIIFANMCMYFYACFFKEGWNRQDETMRHIEKQNESGWDED
jgi:hypothetical protein